MPGWSAEGVKKSVEKALVITLVVVLGLPAFGLMATAGVNAVATSIEASEIASYGQKVRVGDRELNVVISGDHADTVVLLPGLGTAAPGLDFAPLIDELDDTYRVIAVEPFGTGLSDQTDAPRTTANIVAEVHEALAQLGVARYALAAHSISGLYALTYVEEFRDEVSAFVGIDSSVPGQPGGEEPIPIDLIATLNDLGITRAIRAVSPDPYAGTPFTAETKRQMGLLATKNSAASTMVDEMAHAADNFRDAAGRSFPVDLPVLLFVRLDDTDVEGWVGLHREQAASVTHGILVEMHGDHYLHYANSPQIARDMDFFLAEVDRR